MAKVEFTYQPKQKKLREAVERFPVVFFGGAKGGGKSYGLRALVLELCLKHKGLTAAIFRKTYPELLRNHIEKIKKEHPALAPYYRQTDHRMDLPNGSVIEFNYCDNEADLENYQGAEYDILAIDEAGQWTEKIFRTLYGCNRTSKPGFSPRCILTGNPGGIGHAWLKRIFIDRDFNDDEDADDYFFIQSLVTDNMALMDNDPAYLKRLNSEKNEMLKKAYRYGVWDLQAGQFFTELRREVHLIKPFTIPAHWRRFGVYDPGWSHPTGFGWLAADEEGTLYFYRAYLQRHRRVDQIARDVHQFEDTKVLRHVVAGLDAWAKGRQGGPTIAEQFARLPKELRLNFVKAHVDRIQGAAEIRKRLAWEDMAHGMKGPRLFFFDTPDCKRVYQKMTEMVHDPDKPEDVLKVDADDDDVFSGDEFYDLVRYGCMSRPLKAKAVEQEQEIPTAAETRSDRFQRIRKKMRSRGNGHGKGMEDA